MSGELLDFSPRNNPTLISDCCDAWFEMGVEFAQVGEITPMMHLDAGCALDLVVERADEIVEGHAADWDGPVDDFHKRVLDPWRTFFWRRFDAGVVAGSSMREESNAE